MHQSTKGHSNAKLPARWFRSALLPVLLLLSASPLASATNQETENPPIIRPTGERPAIAVKTRPDHFDGCEVTYHRLFVGNSILEFQHRSDRYFINPISSEYSLRLIHENIPQTEIGIAVFESREFLPNVSEDSLDRYLLSLQRDPSVTRIFHRMSDADLGGASIFLDRPFQDIAYEYQDGSRSLVRREVFVQTGGKLLSITIKGTKGDIERNWKKFDRLLSEFDLLAAGS